MQWASFSRFARMATVPLLVAVGTVPAMAQTCYISDISTLKSCASNINSYTTLAFTNNVTCSSSQDCCSSGGPLINLDNQSNKTIEGNGHILKRSAPQTCRALSGSSMNNITIRNLSIDEDELVSPCGPDDGCANTIEFGSTSTSNSAITFSNVGIYNAKSIALAGVAVNGFTFDNSVIANSGVLGLYFGQAESPSQHVYVTNSVFSRTRTAAVNFLGVGQASGSGYTDNRIEGNVFDNNHYHGVYIVNGQISNGGQMFLPNANGVTIDSNVFGDSFCENCVSPLVWGIELAEIASMSNANIYSNYFFNTNGYPFFATNPDHLDGTDQIWGNEIYGCWDPSFGACDGLSYPHQLDNASVGNNILSDKSPSVAHGGHSDYAIYRMYYGGSHKEANTSTEGGAIEATFQLSMTPRPGAAYKAIFRCWTSSIDDFPSLDMNCEGQTRHRLLGFSYESGYPGAIPFYRCLIGGDHFVSWDVNCEGTTSEGQLGYAVPR